MKRSQNAYDWLGHGVYFWENNPRRAAHFAAQTRRRSRSAGEHTQRPTVVGAVIDLDRCLNLLDHEMIGLVKDAHQNLVESYEAVGRTPPVNRGGPDRLQRFLDCAVLEHFHTIREEAGLPSFDTVRGVFVEGKPIYPTAGFHEKSHIQVCVRNARCIKGYFRVLPETDD